MPHTTELHGDRLVDEYHWLRDRQDPRVRAHLEAENRHTQEKMRHTQALQASLFVEMKGRIQETDQSVPVKDGPFWYYSRNVEGLQYAIHCRRLRKDQEQVLLDENELARGSAYFELLAYDPSPDHTLLAYAVDKAGDEVYTLFVKDLASGRLLPDRIERVASSFEWSEDGAFVFYTRMDEAHRPNRLFRHRLGSDPSEDVLIYEERDEAFFLYLSKTRSKRYLVMHASSISRDEYHVLEADQPTGRFRVVQPRTKDLEYDLDHHGTHFYFVTNHQAVNFRLCRAPVESPGLENWEEVLAHQPQVKIEQVDLFAKHMLISLREGGLSTIHVRDLRSGQQHRVDFEEPVYTVWLGENPTFETTSFRLVYSSLTTPRTVFDYHLADRRLELKKRQPVLGGYDPAAYVSRRVEAQAPDGTQIPISMVQRRDLPKGPQPTYLVGYGAYGSPYDPTFSSIRLSLLDRGFVFAIAHVRGGGELGRPWYDAGRLANKPNTFTDFIACAQGLIAAGVTSADKLAIGGGSAGGLLIGAVLNMRPGLFATAVADVPFVDVINTMLDRSIPLTVTEYDEWGDPKQAEAYRVMRSYSPYDNVSAQAYPPMLVTAGWNDPRVQYWEPAKWVQRLRDRKTDANPILFKVNLDAGHAGASGRYDYLKELAFEYAFLFDQLGVGASPGDR